MSTTIFLFLFSPIFYANTLQLEGRVLGKQGMTALNKLDWEVKASSHKHRLKDLLYPPSEEMKKRQHLVVDHPIYNFIHAYYSFSTSDLCFYSPGVWFYFTTRYRV